MNDSNNENNNSSVPTTPKTPMTPITPSKWSSKNPSIKRILKEAQEMQKEPNPEFYAAPLEENLFEWHFTIRGPTDTPFSQGIYHGRILLPADYPMKPPDFIFLTPNGRFDTNTKICLSNTSYHPESWQPTWGIRTALLGLISFFPTEGKGAVGAIEYSSEVRKKLARESVLWKCQKCNSPNCDLVLPRAVVANTPSSANNNNNNNSTPSTPMSANQVENKMESNEINNTNSTQIPIVEKEIKTGIITDTVPNANKTQEVNNENNNVQNVNNLNNNNNNNNLNNNFVIQRGSTTVDKDAYSSLGLKIMDILIAIVFIGFILLLLRRLSAAY